MGEYKKQKIYLHVSFLLSLCAVLCCLSWFLLRGTLWFYLPVIILVLASIGISRHLLK